MLSCLIRLVWHSPYLLNLVFFPGRARSALLPYQDFFILFYFFEEGFGRHFANHRYEFLAFFFSSSGAKITVDKKGNKTTHKECEMCTGFLGERNIFLCLVLRKQRTDFPEGF